MKSNAHVNQVLVVRGSDPIAALRRAPAAAAGLVDRILSWVERTRARRDLIALDDRMLHDIGVSRYDAEREARKPFWRP